MVETGYLPDRMNRQHSNHNKQIEIDNTSLCANKNPLDDNSVQSFCLSIAGHFIGINARYQETYDLIIKYVCNEKPEFNIRVTENDFARERNEAAKAHAPQDCSSLEAMAIHRKICEKLLDFDTFLMHGAVVGLDNNAYMFTAESGTGKTTHIKKWLNEFESAYIVNGDKPLISIREGQAFACGTPWCGKEGMSTNIMVPLKAIFLMERSEDNTVEEISFGKAFPFLLQQTYRPNDSKKMQKTLALLLSLKSRLRFFRFRFNNMKDDSCRIAHGAIMGVTE